MLLAVNPSSNPSLRLSSFIAIKKPYIFKHTCDGIDDIYSSLINDVINKALSFCQFTNLYLHTIVQIALGPSYIPICLVGLVKIFQS